MRLASRKPDWQKDIAQERIAILFSIAEKEFASHPQRSLRYADLARLIGKRYNVKIGKYKRRFCRTCLHYLQPGSTARVRTNTSQKAVIVTCGNCGEIMRYPYRREQR